MNYKQKGMFGIGLVVEIVGVMILMGAAIVGCIHLMDGSRRDRAMADTAMIGGLIAQYHMETGKVPNTLTDLTVANGQYGPWLTEVPQDPFTGKEYLYLKNEEGFLIFSAGKDGVTNSTLESGIQADDVGFAGKTGQFSKKGF